MKPYTRSVASDISGSSTSVSSAEGEYYTKSLHSLDKVPDLEPSLGNRQSSASPLFQRQEPIAVYAAVQLPKIKNQQPNLYSTPRMHEHEHLDYSGSMVPEAELPGSGSISPEAELPGYKERENGGRGSVHELGLPILPNNRGDALKQRSDSRLSRGPEPYPNVPGNRSSILSYFSDASELSVPSKQTHNSRNGGKYPGSSGSQYGTLETSDFQYYSNPRSHKSDAGSTYDSPKRRPNVTETDIDPYLPFLVSKLDGQVGDSNSIYENVVKRSPSTTSSLASYTASLVGEKGQRYKKNEVNASNLRGQPAIAGSQAKIAKASSKSSLNRQLSSSSDDSDNLFKPSSRASSRLNLGKLGGSQGSLLPKSKAPSRAGSKNSLHGSKSKLAVSKKLSSSSTDCSLTSASGMQKRRPKLKVIKSNYDDARVEIVEAPSTTDSDTVVESDVDIRSHDEQSLKGIAPIIIPPQENRYDARKIDRLSEIEERSFLNSENDRSMSKLDLDPKRKMFAQNSENEGRSFLNSENDRSMSKFDLDQKRKMFASMSSSFEQERSANEYEATGDRRMKRELTYTSSKTGYKTTFSTTSDSDTIVGSDSDRRLKYSENERSFSEYEEVTSTRVFAKLANNISKPVVKSPVRGREILKQTPMVREITPKSMRAEVIELSASESDIEGRPPRTAGFVMDFSNPKPASAEVIELEDSDISTDAEVKQYRVKMREANRRSSSKDELDRGRESTSRLSFIRKSMIRDSSIESSTDTELDVTITNQENEYEEVDEEMRSEPQKGYNNPSQVYDVPSSLVRAELAQAIMSGTDVDSDFHDRGWGYVPRRPGSRAPLHSDSSMEVIPVKRPASYAETRMSAPKLVRVQEKVGVSYDKEPVDTKPEVRNVTPKKASGAELKRSITTSDQPRPFGDSTDLDGRYRVMRGTVRPLSEVLISPSDRKPVGGVAVLPPMDFMAKFRKNNKDESKKGGATLNLPIVTPEKLDSSPGMRIRGKVDSVGKSPPETPLSGTGHDAINEGSPAHPGYTRKYTYEETSPSDNKRFDPHSVGFNYKDGRNSRSSEDRVASPSSFGKITTGVAFNYAPGEGGKVAALATRAQSPQSEGKLTNGSGFDAMEAMNKRQKMLGREGNKPDVFQRGESIDSTQLTSSSISDVEEYDDNRQPQTEELMTNPNMMASDVFGGKMTAPKIVKTTTKQRIHKNSDGVVHDVEEKIEDLTPGGTGAITFNQSSNKADLGDVSGRTPHVSATQVTTRTAFSTENKDLNATTSQVQEKTVTATTTTSGQQQQRVVTQEIRQKSTATVLNDLPTDSPIVKTEAIKYDPTSSVPPPLPTIAPPFVQTELRQVGGSGGPGTPRLPSAKPTSLDEMAEIISSQTVTSKTRTVETVTYQREHDGVVETHVEQKITIQSDGDPVDHDRALAEAIQEATAMNPDMTVEKIEIQQQIAEK